MVSRSPGQQNTAPLAADLTIRLPPVQHTGNLKRHCRSFSLHLDRLINNDGFSLYPSNLGSRNHSAARVHITDGNMSTIKTRPRPCPAIGEGGATLNPGWHPTDTGGRVNNNPSNYTNRRRSPSPSVRKSPGHQPTNQAMGITHQHRPNNLTAARSSYHAGCQHTNQSRIPVYQRNQSFDTVHNPPGYILQTLLLIFA